MDLKEFLRPNKSKVLNTILLLGVLILISFLCIILISPYSSLLYPVWILSLNITAPFFFLTILLIAYIFGCYINKNKKWSNGIFLFIVTSIVASISLLILSSLIIPWWNATFAQSCNVDSDCHEHGNDLYIDIIYPYSMMGFRECAVMECKNKTCKEVYSSENLHSCSEVRMRIVALSNTTDNAIIVFYSSTGRPLLNTNSSVEIYYNGIKNATTTSGVLAVNATTTLTGTSFSPGNSVQLFVNGQQVSSCTVTSEGATYGYMMCL